VADAAALRGLFDLAEEKFGGLDVVVLNAAAWRFATIAEATDEDFDVVFNTNARGTFVALHEAANRVRDGGRIVAISAGLALMPRPATGLYGASKAAINHLVRVLANEIGSRQITVNSVMPGADSTDALKENPDGDALVAVEIARTPLGRVGAPEDIADVVGFLVSDDGRWITGQNIGAGGGMFRRRPLGWSPQSQVAAQQQLPPVAAQQMTPPQQSVGQHKSRVHPGHTELCLDEAEEALHKATAVLRDGAIPRMGLPH
jgi:3-oxoacyl-[acyl-carrier protein] reductase